VEVPHLQRLYQTYSGKGLAVVGIAGIESAAEDIPAFLKRYKTTYPIVLDPDQAVTKLYGVGGHPTNVLVDRKGKVRYFRTGFSKDDQSMLDAAVKAALGGKTLAEANRPSATGG